jgi:hypothetical protein
LIFFRQGIDECLRFPLDRDNKTHGIRSNSVRLKYRGIFSPSL